jgi:hypothetical protein
MYMKKEATNILKPFLLLSLVVVCALNIVGATVFSVVALPLFVIMGVLGIIYYLLDGKGDDKVFCFLLVLCSFLMIFYQLFFSEPVYYGEPMSSEIKGLSSELLAVAEDYRIEKGTYVGMEEDSRITDILSSIARIEPQDNNILMGQEGNDYCFKIDLPFDNQWCIDSDGYEGVPGDMYDKYDQPWITYIFDKRPVGGNIHCNADNNDYSCD